MAKPIASGRNAGSGSSCAGATDGIGARDRGCGGADGIVLGVATRAGGELTGGELTGGALAATGNAGGCETAVG